MIDDAEDRLAAMKKGDQRAEERPPGDEGFRAVDGIEDPDILGIGSLGGKLLADQAMMGIGELYDLPQRRLRLAIGDGDRTRIRFGDDFHVRTEIAAYDLAA